jgi:hypothetical protein
MVKTLYFDIDGTLLGLESGRVKPALVGGEFEQKVRGAGFDDLVCVGSVINVIRAVGQLDRNSDGMSILLNLCSGAFSGERWFRDSVRLVDDPEQRVRHIDFSGDWWYVDDLAAHYFGKAGLGDIFEKNLGIRVFVPDPDGDGNDVLGWLNQI